MCAARVKYDAVALEQINTLLGTELDLRRTANRRARPNRTQPVPRPRPSGRRRI